MNKDKLSFTLINILRNVVSIYFDTFFTIYFFKLVNYQILPMAKYYLVIYLTIVFSFWVLRNAVKKNFKVSYFRIGLSFTALYIAAILMLKERIPNYVYLVAILKGLGEGFYYYPRNVLNSTKITNAERKRYDGTINAINQVTSIVMPVVLGLLIDSYSYIQMGKVVFILIIVCFLLSFLVEEGLRETGEEKINVKGFLKKIKNNKKVKEALLVQFLRGFTISAGVLTVVMSLYKINYFQSNSKIGSLNSILGILTCIACIVYSMKVKKKVYKTFTILTTVSLSILLVGLAIKPDQNLFIIYLFVYSFGVAIINLLGDNITVNCSNDESISEKKEEYHLILETVLGISRTLGYVALLAIGLIGNFELLKHILTFSIIPLVLLCIVVIKNLDNVS